MEDKKIYSSHSDFIKDVDFVKWAMTKDEQLGEYWQCLIADNPQLKPYFDDACRYFDNVRLQKEELLEPAKSDLLLRIKKSSAKANRKHKISIALGYVAAACLILGVFLFTNNKYSLKTPDSLIASIETGKLLSEDICLITSSGTTSFKKDIEVVMDSEKRLSVQEKGNKKKIEYAVDYQSMNKLIVPYGKRSQLTLPDGTKVWVNSGSVLEFPSQFETDVRKIKLSGEVYLDVAKNTKPFIVETDDFGVRVYGTKFNVSAYPNYRQTVVLEQGSVGVNFADGSETRMKPRELLAIEDKQIKKKEENIIIEQFTSWKNGYLYFDNAPMLDVLSQIGRYYNLSFNYDNYQELENRHCSGKISLSSDIDDVLTTLALLSSGVYEQENQKIYFNVKQ